MTIARAYPAGPLSPLLPSNVEAILDQKALGVRPEGAAPFFYMQEVEDPDEPTFEDVPLPTKLLGLRVGLQVPDASHGSECRRVPKGFMPGHREDGSFEVSTTASTDSLCRTTDVFHNDGAAHASCTLVVRHLPKCLQHQNHLLQLWSPKDWKYDFLYLPFCERRRHHASYCFINFLSEEAASRFSRFWSQNPVTLQCGLQTTVHMDKAEVQGFTENMMHVCRRLNGSRLKQVHPPAIFNVNGEPVSFFEVLPELPNSEQWMDQLTLKL